jgi:hypothetical protein
MSRQDFIGIEFWNVRIRQCDVFLPVIGPLWLSALRELDVVRLEVQEALHLRKRIIPVLVQSARMPSPHELPLSLQRFGYQDLEPVEVTDDRWASDVERLIEIIECSQSDAPNTTNRH